MYVLTCRAQSSTQLYDGEREKKKKLFQTNLETDKWNSFAGWDGQTEPPLQSYVPVFFPARSPP